MSNEVFDLNEHTDRFRIFISTDNHLGYNEKHPERGDDSFRAFEEVLQKARSLHADMVLLGGDLFHHNKPTRQTGEESCLDFLVSANPNYELWPF